MDEALQRLGWIVLAAIGGAYLTFLGADAVFKEKTATSTPVVIRDILRQGQHHLYGKLVVPSSCDEVTVKVMNTAVNSYELAFTTWPEPEAKCIDAPAEREFDTIIFAPSLGVQFTATLDKKPLPVAIYPSVEN